MGNFVDQAINSFINSRDDITPTEKNYIDTLRSGDSSKGIELATNICNSMGVSKEQAYGQAKRFFQANGFFHL